MKQKEYIIIAVAIVVLLLLQKKSQESPGSNLSDQARKRIADYVKSLWYKKIKYFAALYKLPEKRIAAIVAQESAGQPNARGSIGEIGLMQLTPGAIKEVNEILKLDKTLLDIQHSGGTSVWDFVFGSIIDKAYINIFDPDINLQYGAAYLSILLDRNGGIDAATKRYNGTGPAADQYLESVKKFEQYF